MKRKNTGFTLIELMFAVVALSFGLTVIIRSYIVALDGIQKTENITVASSFISTKFEDLKLNSVYTSSAVVEGRSSGEFVSKTGKPFYWDLEVSKGPAKILNEITLIIAWKEGGQARTLMAKTYMKRPPE